MQKMSLLVTAVLLAASSEGCGNQSITPEIDIGNPDSGVTLVDSDIGRYALVNAYPNLTFDRAVFAAGVPGDNRIAVVEQRGKVVAFVDDQNTAQSKTVLDITSTIEFGGEQGLLGLAFDPAFEDNRFVYLHYTMNSPRRSVIARLTWSPTDDAIDPATELIILEVAQPYRNHNAGMLEFGPDNYLYVAMGDGGSGGDPEGHGQNGMTLLGSMLRIDVANAAADSPYQIPPDNPFVGNGDVRDEIYALGLRNPYRFSFDRNNGELWLGDVGQGAWEEINVIEAGGNYGWRFYEGNDAFDNTGNTQSAAAFKAPVLAYNRGAGYSVTGGYVYRGQQLNRLAGYYLYADYGSGTVWALRRESASVSNSILATAANPTSFGETNSGEILIVTHSSGLFRLVETDR